MKKLFTVLVVLALLLGMTACGSAAASEPTELTISAAASLTDVMAEIAELYKEEAPNTTLTITYGASGSLMTQIQEGAPTDVFISAAQKQMDTLEEAGLIIDDSRIDLLENKVVLIVPSSSDSSITSFEDLATDQVEKVAIGDPSSVPAGQYAQAVLTNLGIFDEVDAKAVYGTDVRQVLSWVESGDVDAGIVYATDAMTTDLVTVVTQADEGLHDPIIYPAAIIADTENQDAAQAFLEFLTTEDVSALFEKYGFTPL